MMKSKFICAVLAFSMAFSSVAFAETSAQKVYDRTNNTIVVSGTTDKAGEARLLVLNPGTDVTNMTDAQIWAQTVYADEVSITSGTFTFDTFQMSPTLEGTYIIRVACGNDIKEVTVDYASVARTIELLLSATDASTLSSYINKYNDVYLFDVGVDSKYASFSDEGKSWVLNSICSDDLVVDLATAQKAFTTYSSLWRVKAEPWASVREVIDNNSAAMGLSLTKYSMLTNDEKDYLANSLSGNLYLDLSAFQTAIDNSATDIINNRGNGSGESDDSGRGDGFNVSFGGGGGGGARPSVPATKPEEKPAEDKNETVVDFNDIDNHWAQDSIMLLAKKGIVNGKDANNFDPEGYVTRAEAIKMLILAFGELDADAVTDFGDVSADSWMYPYIATAANNGILNGYEDGTVGANNTVTRQDLCVMILRTARAFGIELGNSDEDVSFTDADTISDYAKEAVKALRGNNIISGFDDGSFGPAKGTTRAQISKMIAGFLK